MVSFVELSLLVLACAASLATAYCPLENYQYSGTQFSDAYGHQSSAKVHPDFVQYMNDMNGYAKNCGVQIKVTDHFRTAPVTGNDWNAQKSCHMIGHAIDMNLQGGNGYCNSVCLWGYRNYNGPDSSINCFLKKIDEHHLLHWGIGFNDPVHIDDRVCTNAAEWDTIYATLTDC